MEIKYVIALVLLILFLSMVLPGALNAFEKLYASSYFKPEYKDFASKSLVEGQFDAFVNNLNSCKANTKSKCICNDVFPSFPNVFPKEFSLKIDNGQKGDITATLLYLGKEEVKKSTIENIFFLPMSMQSQNKVKDEKIDISYILTFEGGNANIGKTKILSSGIYKSTNMRIGTLIYSSWIGIINWASPIPSESKQLSYISLLPKC